MSKTVRAGGILLDTCAAIWIANKSPMAIEALDAVFYAGVREGIFVSPVSAWEVGLLDRRRATNGLQFLPDAKTWFTRLMSAPSIRAAPFTPDIAISASSLPEPLHADPADRLLIATARHLGFPIITRDQKIEAYAVLGHVKMIRC
jgi:PIN domain nuclease of toxin-antitoxin system